MAKKSAARGSSGRSKKGAASTAAIARRGTLAAAERDEKNASAVALGRLGGSRNTPAQHAARVANAQFAGRPRRVCADCGEPVRGFHLDRALDETCRSRAAWRWQKPSER